MTTSTDIERTTPAEPVAFTSAQIDTLRQTLCRDLSDPELQLFLAMCEKYSLDPFSRQIYATKSGRGNDAKLTPITSIDGFRLIAQRSGQYAGQRPPAWTSDGREWVDVWLEKTPPAACRVSVLRHDWSEPLTVTYTWAEYTGGRPSFMQQKMPAHMLAKATEALALRKAFPNDLGGLYTSDEIPPDVQAPVAGQSAELPTRSAAAPASAPVDAIVDLDTYSRIVGLVQQLPESARDEFQRFSTDTGIRWKPTSMTAQMAEAAEAKAQQLLDAAEEITVDVIDEEPSPRDPSPSPISAA